jgi:hypothetical protein
MTLPSTFNFMKNVIIALLIVFVFACTEEDQSPCSDTDDCIEQGLFELDSLKQVIIAEVQDGNCEGASECKFVGFGSKPCGGPWEYLIYSTNADTERILDLVEDYNELEKIYNEEKGLVSYCSIAIKPDSVICDGGGCVAYNAGLAFTEGVCCN